MEELLKAHGEPEREVYLDLENSAPVAREVLEAMLPYFAERAYGNPSITHKPGWMAYDVVQRALEEIRRHLGASRPEEINFIPGATEANNLALMGAALANRRRGRRIIVSRIEPLNVLHVALNLLRPRGFEVVEVPVDGEGFIDLDALGEAVNRETILVSISAVNHEIGTIQPLREAVELVKDKNPDAVFHTDASDAYGRIPFNVGELGVDMATVSSYKVLGPRGVAALYVGEGVEVERLLEGQLGTQRLWPGVENVPLIVGFQKASELLFRDFEGNTSHMRRLRNRLMEGLLKSIPETLLNGPRERRAPDNVNISFLGCEGEALTIELSLHGVYVSSGSACTRRLLQPSHVLTAIGRRPEEAHGSILMKVSRMYCDEDVDYVLRVLPGAVERLRGLSPLKGEGGDV
ncbi:MAG: cysteine sulfinate desulfinase [Candidatus Bathyarchaeota archaeon B23]|nr:MAG: cysteine sulfinate desulfinase [Candidatus Bathyarchaeota archaeon B23]